MLDIIANILGVTALVVFAVWTGRIFTTDYDKKDAKKQKHNV